MKKRNDPQYFRGIADGVERQRFTVGQRCEISSLRAGLARASAFCLLARLILGLNKRTKMAASLVIRCPGLAVGVSASRVVALPLHSLSRGDPRQLLDLLCRVT